jgi:hypothetical protein
MNPYLLRSELIALGSDPKFSQLDEDLDRRMHGPLTPNFEVSFRIRTKSPKTLEKLAVISHFLPETLGFFLRFSVEQQNERFVKSEDLRLLLISKEFSVLSLSRKLSERDFFGNWKREMVILLRELSFVLSGPPKARRTIRRRGYRDHGTLRPPHRWLPDSDWSFDAIQRQIEEDREFKAAVHDWNLKIVQSLTPL